MAEERKCKNCKFYSRLKTPVIDSFSCVELFKKDLLGVELDDGFATVEAFYPEPDFGCILWESKGEK